MDDAGLTVCRRCTDGFLQAAGAPGVIGLAGAANGLHVANASGEPWIMASPSAICEDCDYGALSRIR